jgi:hypothetical protein
VDVVETFNWLYGLRVKRTSPGLTRRIRPAGTKRGDFIGRFQEPTGRVKSGYWWSGEK